LDVSKVVHATQPHRFHGLEIAVRTFGGARGLRIVHPAGQSISAHRHDWPLLTLPMLGGYCEECEDGTVVVDGPAAILHPAGICHANCIHSQGMETFSIEFDPAWLGSGAADLRLDRSSYWVGGEVPLGARSLIRLWSNPDASEAALRNATVSFLLAAVRQREKRSPMWFEKVALQLTSADPRTAGEVAANFGLHPRWLAQAYRSAAGEGLRETVVRRRVEQAVQLLRSTDEPIVEIALAAGFCDQSHLNRSLRRLTGRTPVQIRAERELLQPLMAA
jgi:AraC family transcriptional regulator